MKLKTGVCFFDISKCDKTPFTLINKIKIRHRLSIWEMKEAISLSGV